MWSLKMAVEGRTVPTRFVQVKAVRLVAILDHIKAERSGFVLERAATVFNQRLDDGIAVLGKHIELDEQRIDWVILQARAHL